MIRVILTSGLMLLLASPMVCAAEDDSGLVIRPRAIPTPIDVSTVTRKLRSADLREVRKAAQELADSHNAKALPLLVNLCMEGDAQRRMIGFRCIGKLKQPGAEEMLFKCALGDIYVSLRLAAVEELARLETPERAAARFVEVLTNEKSLYKDFRYRALQALAHVGGKAASDCLTQWLNQPQTDMAVAAAEGLGLQKDLSVATPLITALGSGDPDIKSAAADALERLSGEKFRFDLIKWTQWQKEQAAGNTPKKEVASPSDKPTGDEYDAPAKYPEADAVDIVIVFDTTGSMLHIWPQVSTAIDAIVGDLIKVTPSLRLGTVKYRAADPRRTQTYTIKAKPLTRKFEEIREDILDATFGGGSGGLQLGLDYAVRAMPWRVMSRKIIILVGDTSPTDESTRNCLRTIAEAWQMDGILVNTLYVRTQHGSEHFDTYRALALGGRGHFYEYNKAEKHLVEMSADKIDVRKAEMADETARKMCQPRP